MGFFSPFDSAFLFGLGGKLSGHLRQLCISSAYHTADHGCARTFKYLALLPLASGNNPLKAFLIAANLLRASLMIDLLLLKFIVKPAGHESKWVMKARLAGSRRAFFCDGCSWKFDKPFFSGLPRGGSR